VHREQATMAIVSGVTLDEFVHMEDEKPALEYGCGEVTQKPMPDRSHSIIQRYFIRVLCQFLERTGIGEVFPEFRCIFGPAGRERAFVPDLTYVAKERLTADRYHRAPPDLAIEILSRDQNMARFLDRI
jgi:Uma2 family endonuclease